MCALDLEPFSIVVKRGFNLFCNWNKISDLPSDRTVPDIALNLLLEQSLYSICQLTDGHTILRGEHLYSIYNYNIPMEILFREANKIYELRIYEKGQ